MIFRFVPALLFLKNTSQMQQQSTGGQLRLPKCIHQEN